MSPHKISNNSPSRPGQQPHTGRDGYKTEAPTPHESVRPDFLAGTVPIDAEEEKAMEDRATSGAAEDKAQNQGLSPKALESAESAGGSITPTSAEQEEGESPGLFKDTGKGKKKGTGRLSPRKKLLGGGIVGLLVAAIFGVLTITSGPLQFIHIAQLLQKFHFTNQEDASDDRMAKIGRYLKYAKEHPEKTRLNILGNKYADRIERKFNKSGIESAYTDRFGYFDGYVIDPAKIPQDSEISRLANKSPEEITEHFKRTYDVDLTPGPNGTLLASSDGLGYFKSRKMIRAVLQEAGYSKLGASIRARIMGKRAGITWHPMKKLDRKILESIDARYTKWKEERQKRIDEGETSTRTSQAQEDADGDGNPDQPTEESTQAKAATDEVIGEAEAAGKEVKSGVVTPDGPMAKLRSSTGFKLAGGASAAIGIVCLVKAISDNIDDIKYANVVLPLIRLGMEMVTAGNQIMSGRDFDIETLGFYAKQFFSPETGSWAAARSIQAELGDEPTGTDIRDEAQIKEGKNSVSKFIDGIPGIAGVCKATNSKVGQVVSFGIDVLSGPVSAIAGQGFGYFLAPKLIEGLTNWIAGHPISLDVAGADFGNYMNYGARLAANDSFIAAGGKKLSGTETVQLKLHQLESERELQKTKSFADRMFDPYDSGSLISKIIDKQNPQIGANFAHMAGSAVNVSNILSLVPNMFGSVVTPKASAASTYDYGFSLYGFSVNELNNETTENPYENAETVDAILAGSKGEEFKKRAVKCFGIGFKGDDNQPVSESTPPPYHKMPDNCTEDDEDWLRLRFYIFDTQLMESTVCYEGDESACEDVGFVDTVYQSGGTTGTTGSKIVGDVGESSDSVPCAEGTKDLGVVESKYTGSAKKTDGPLKVRLCQVPVIDGYGDNTEGNNITGGAVVNSRVSGAILALGNDATKDNVHLTSSSSFRYADSCGGGGDGLTCAAPGSSWHQLGVAIDFGEIDGIDTSRQSCDVRMRADGNPYWEWLHDNAERYGFKQYSAEAWHWDVSPASNRCGSG